nr:outer membrane protein [Mesorhizobium sp.]
MKANLKFARPLVAAAALAVASAIPAFAADAVYEQAPEPAPVEVVPSASTGWAGPYAGVQAGYTFGRADLPGVGTHDHDGFNGGAFAGVQGQNGSIVYGVEGDVGYNGAKGSNAGIDTKSGVEGSLRARLGYAVNDRVLLYGTGGGAAESLKASSALGSDRKTMLGYTVGAGADVKVTERVFVRGEYRFTDYGKETFNLGGVSQDVETHSNKVQLGLGVKF